MSDESDLDFFMKFGAYIIVIDDDACNGGRLEELLKEFSSHHIPFAAFTNLPDKPDEMNSFFSRAALLLLDYSFSPNVPGISSLSNENDQLLINLLSAFCESTLAPALIFTSNPIHARTKIMERLDPRYSSRVFVTEKINGKSAVAGIREEIVRRYETTDYEFDVYKKWRDSLESAMKGVFLDLFYESPDWIKWLYEDAKDGNDRLSALQTSINFSSFLNQNLISRFRSPVFEIPSQGNDKKPSGEETIKMYQSLRTERFREVEIGELSFREGDIFKLSKTEMAQFFPYYEQGEGAEHFYLVNVNAPCSLTRKENPFGIFLIGTPCDLPRVSKKESKAREEFKKAISKESSRMFIGFLSDKAVRFRYDVSCGANCNSLKGFLVGRLLDPYISELRSHYLLFINRSGLLCEGPSFHASLKKDGINQ